LAAGDSLRQIRLGRVPSTIAREVDANGGRSRFRAMRADRAAVQRRRRPKVCKLAATPRLRAMVAAKLEQRWSPEQIAGWLKRTYPHEAELQVSHETIYRTLFVQSRGALKRELTEHLRTRGGGSADPVVATTGAPTVAGSWSTSSTSRSAPRRPRTGRCRATGKAT
jgi:IS30 family transposase